MATADIGSRRRRDGKAALCTVSRTFAGKPIADVTGPQELVHVDQPLGVRPDGYTGICTGWSGPQADSCSVRLDVRRKASCRGPRRTHRQYRWRSARRYHHCDHNAAKVILIAGRAVSSLMKCDYSGTLVIGPRLNQRFRDSGSSTRATPNSTQLQAQIQTRKHGPQHNAITFENTT